jgi:general secretion pathway protein G
MHLGSKNKGFTLIELLVVIAIIGILATIVLVSLGTGRTKAKDASAKASMNSMRSEAELAATATGYPDLCTRTSGSEGKLDTLMDAVESKVSGTVTCNDSSTDWAAEVTLNDGTLFCVDSSGFAGKPSSALGTAISCNR